MGRVVFIPWNKFQNAEEFAGYVTNWNSANTHSNHQWTTVTWRANTAAPSISNLSFGSTIRIIVHSNPGCHKIFCDLQGGNPLTYETVCDRLIASGLSRTFAGTIDCHSCSSGVPSLGSQSFAAKVAMYLRLNGYAMVSVAVLTVNRASPPS